VGGALVFTLAILVAFAAIGARRLSAWRKQREQLARPGRDEGAPIVVHDYEELEATWRRERCACGGRFELLGESTVTGGGGTVTCVLLKCSACDKRDAVYFDVSGVPS
jgi:hypothetical protein